MAHTEDTQLQSESGIMKALNAAKADEVAESATWEDSELEQALAELQSEADGRKTAKLLAEETVGILTGEKERYQEEASQLLARIKRIQSMQLQLATLSKYYRNELAAITATTEMLAALNESIA